MQNTGHKTKRHNEDGFSHVIVPLLLFMAIGIVGTFSLVSTYAAKGSSRFPPYRNLHGNQVATAKRIANEYWGGKICGPQGKNIKLIYYSNDSYLKKIFPGQASLNPNGQIQSKYGHNALAYANDGAGLYKNPEYCRIYINSDAMKFQYNWLNGPIDHMNPAQMQCEIIVHETGHLKAYRNSRGINGDHYHSPDNRNIMYGGTQDRIRGAFYSAPNCRSAF